MDDDRAFAEGLTRDGEQLGLSVALVHEAPAFGHALTTWKPTIIAMDLVMPESDGLEHLRTCARHRFEGHLILMSGGFELYLKMAEEIASRHGLSVAAKLAKPLRAKQFAYLLMSLI